MFCLWKNIIRIWEEASVLSRIRKKCWLCSLTPSSRPGDQEVTEYITSHLEVLQRHGGSWPNLISRIRLPVLKEQGENTRGHWGHETQQSAGSGFLSSFHTRAFLLHCGRSSIQKTVNGDTSVVEVPLPWFILAVAKKLNINLCRLDPLLCGITNLCL